MGLLNKKKKQTQVIEDQQHLNEPKKELGKKKKSDKSIKPRAPRSSAGKKIIRGVFWTIVCLILLKGAISFAQGTRVINQTNVYGNTEIVVSDAVKGFALDFATEYFTWDANYTQNRETRLKSFINGINSDMGMKTFDATTSSKVTSAEVYNSKSIDKTNFEVTVAILRTVTPLPDKLLSAQGKAEQPEATSSKTYMVVPVTLAAEGPVIKSYPRFVSEQVKGETIDPASEPTSIVNEDLVKKATELADSYLRSWYEGNSSQIKYFYASTSNVPTSLNKSEFTYTSLDKVSVYAVPENNGTDKTYRIVADVLVKSAFGEPFNNSWSLTVVEQDEKLFVVSNGIDQTATPVKATDDEPTPTPDESNASTDPMESLE
ncbi:conjugal transfer protein [Paenibacillus sp. MMO-177]|uniref:conjugal transfer protein n=1 Tax=Paenibacillus sp. MMO-177 TaxID=3081289 RepID=UPI00301AC6A2